MGVGDTELSVMGSAPLSAVPGQAFLLMKRRPGSQGSEGLFWVVWWGWVDGRDVTVSFIQQERGPTPFSQPEDPDVNTEMEFCHLRSSCKKVLSHGLSEGVSSPSWRPVCLCA